MSQKDEFQNAALVLLGHGSTKNSDSVLSVVYQAQKLRQRGVFGGVYEAFWKVEPKIDGVLDAVQEPTIYIVPFFLSEGHFTQVVIPGHLGLKHGKGLWRGKELIYCRPVGVHPGIDQIIDRRIHALLECPSAPNPAQTCLFIAGHGTNQNAHSGQLVVRQAERIRQMGQFAQVQAIFLDQEPAIADWRLWTTLGQIAVIPYFLSDGLHVAEDIPPLFGFQDGADMEKICHGSGNGSREPQIGSLDITQSNIKKDFFSGSDLVILKLNDRKIWYMSSLGQEDLMADVIKDLCRKIR